MPLYDFIPGTWMDTIDVNDFVNLNKKPFLKEPFFLASPSTDRAEALAHSIREALKPHDRSILLEFSSLDQEVFRWLNFELDEQALFVKPGFSENLHDIKSHYRLRKHPSRTQFRKTTAELFEDVATPELKKMLKIGLLSHTPHAYTPAFFHSDFRIVPLYGTRRLVKEKRWELKMLEKHLQTPDWIQRRLLIQREIEAIKQFEQFAKKHGCDPAAPADSAEQAIDYLLLAAAAAFAENPSIPFSFSQVLPFLDIYLEHDLQHGFIDENRAQELITFFYFRLAFFRFVLSPGLLEPLDAHPFFLGETIGGELVTKTTYRFLSSFRNFRLYPFVLRIAWTPHLPAPFADYCDALAKEGIPLSVFQAADFPHAKEACFYPHGQSGLPSQSALFDGGACNLEKVLYLALNGGKDAEHGVNLLPITQPHRPGPIDFDQTMAKFQEYLAYTVSAYAEMMNIVLYLNDIHHSHPFRSSLSSHLVHYQVQFGFSRMNEAVRLLTAIQQGAARLETEKGGWIRRIDGAAHDVDAALFSQVSSLILQEIKRIPLYKTAQASVKLYPDSPFSQLSPEAALHQPALHKEWADVLMGVNVACDGLPILPLAQKLFGQGFSEVNVSFDPANRLLHGVWYREKQQP